MSIAFATIYGYIAFTAAGSLVFHTLCRRAAHRAEVERREVLHQVPQVVHELKRAA